MRTRDRIQELVRVVPFWYEKNKRILPWREDPTPYKVWVSEIMLQQTRIETVIPYYRRFLEELPDISSLAGADPNRLNKLWEGLGYYSRVSNMQTAAKEIMEKYQGKFPGTYEEIIKLKGIGPYTAGAIASICFHQPAAAVDGNVYRVLSRILADSISFEEAKKTYKKLLEEYYPKDHPGALTQGIMELGETICLPGGEPSCSLCPCKDFCKGYMTDPTKYPPVSVKKMRKKDDYTILLLRYNSLVAIKQRDLKGLLAGLWEFPNVKGKLSKKEVLALAESWGLKPKKIQAGKKHKHIFTHIEWNMTSYQINCDQPAESFHWVTPEELENTYSLPTAFKVFVERKEG